MITTSIVNGITIYERTATVPGYYAVINESDNSIISVGYNSNYIGTPNLILEPSSMYTNIYNSSFQVIGQRNPIEAFLLTIYFNNVEIAGDEKFNLHAEIKANSSLAHYASIKLADFMAFTGGKSSYYKIPSGETKNLFDVVLIDPNAARPFLVDMVDKNYDLMFQIINHLGLFGVYAYLFEQGGISFEELCREIKNYYTSSEERSEYYYTELLPFLRSKKTTVFTNEQIQSIIS